MAPAFLRNLASGCRLIATKSRRYNAVDRKFIADEIEKLLYTGLIPPSNSPWHAQVLLVKNQKFGKRLCMNYSQTINLHTLLDAYPLPRIEDLMSNMSV